MSVKKSNRIIPLSEHFGVSPDAFIKLGVLDVPLNTDTPLFIDPQLLKNSTYEIFNTDAWNAYQDFYHDLYHKVQMLVQEKDNSIKGKIVKSLKMALKAKEPIGLCLGYSKSNNRGRGIGKDVANVIVRTATHGRGWYQEWGKPAVELKPGDKVNIAPGTKHWHGAAQDSWFTHIAIEVPSENGRTEWLEPVSDTEYNKLK